MTNPKDSDLRDKMKQTNQSNDEKEQKPKAIEEGSGATMPTDEVCRKAPEWAEHSRLQDADEPCDDGRSGNLGRRPPKD